VKQSGGRRKRLPHKKARQPRYNFFMLTPTEKIWHNGRSDRLEGKIAALDAEAGIGHVILLGFKPQWRGQAHAAYKFFFNALYKQE
jgi:hypothetical protein